MDGHRFDSLARLLVSSQSRRRVLKGIAGALVGARAVGLESASAQGNAACAQFCRDNFTGRARGACVSAAAGGSGPCYECGPAAPQSHGPICSGTCCPPDEVCGDAGCVPAGFSCQQDSDCQAVFPGQLAACLPPGCDTTSFNRPECAPGNTGICCSLEEVTQLPRVGNCGGVCTDLNFDRQNCGACGRVCRDVEICDPFEHRCCIPIGDPCQSPTDPCCGPVGQCTDGVCRNPCVPPGHACSPVDVCCSGESCTDGLCPCVPDGGSCGGVDVCCSGASCTDNVCPSA